MKVSACGQFAENSQRDRRAEGHNTAENAADPEKCVSNHPVRTSEDDSRMI